MSEYEELMNYIMNWTPRQLKEFLTNEVTLSILRPAKAPEVSLSEDSLQSP